MKMQETTVSQETLELEAATAINAMQNSTDLDQRIGVLRDRVGVANERLAAFILTMPEGYDAEDRAVFSKYITDTLEKLAEEAHQQVKFERTWNRLGDDG